MPRRTGPAPTIDRDALPPETGGVHLGHPSRRGPRASKAVKPIAPREPKSDAAARATPMIDAKIQQTWDLLVAQVQRAGLTQTETAKLVSAVLNTEGGSEVPYVSLTSVNELLHDVDAVGRMSFRRLLAYLWALGIPDDVWFRALQSAVDAVRVERSGVPREVFDEERAQAEHEAKMLATMARALPGWARHELIVMADSLNRATSAARVAHGSPYTAPSGEESAATALDSALRQLAHAEREALSEPGSEEG